MSPEDLPDDASGDALRRLLADGSDLSRPMDIDFHVAVPTEAAGHAIAAAVAPLGFSARVVEDDEDDQNGSWTCWCTKSMIASHAEITATEHLLDEVSGPHGGYSDGWGSFGNTASE
ncbi:MAG: ribonuclease E inhibitor RraB [Planctomycetota bacterium]|jgi:regulator of RNase E activity RraB